MDEIFKKIADAQASNKGNNFTDGKGIVVVREVLYKNLNDGPTFIAATKVIESASKGDVDPVTKQPVIPNAVGSCPSWPQKINKFKSAPGNVKAFVLSLLGFKESEVTSDQFGEALGRIVGKEQPARGMLIRYETYQQVTQGGPNKGNVNSYVKWSHVAPESGNSKAEIAARRAELDKTDPVQA